jgi:ketosteroid isomerase-like protein
MSKLQSKAERLTYLKRQSVPVSRSGKASSVDLCLAFAEKTDWKFVGPASLPYAGFRTNRKEVADFFEALVRADDTAVFEPREFIEAGEHVTVLGWTKVTARETQKTFETEWVHVSTVRDGKITR